MSALDAMAAKLAKQMLKQYGKRMLYETLASKTVNHTTGVVTRGTATQVAFKGYISTAVEEYNKSAENAVQAEYRLVCARLDLGFTPEHGGRVYLGATTAAPMYQVVAVRPFYSGDDIAYYDLYLGR